MSHPSFKDAAELPHREDHYEPPDHEARLRLKTAKAYTTDDGRHIPEHTLHLFDCSCGHRGSVWYASEERAHQSWERHTHA